MLERTFWGARVDVDHLADELVRWFRRRGFETQNLSEGRSRVVVQARKASWLRTVSGMNLALTVRLTSHREDLQVEIGASEWTDKAIGGALAWLVAWPFAITTGIGLFQQSQLPQETLDYIATYIDTQKRRAARQAERADQSRPEQKERAPEEAAYRRGQGAENFWIEQELAELEAFDARLREARGETAPRSPHAPSETGKDEKAEGGPARGREIELDPADLEIDRPPQDELTCPECQAPIEPEDRFCMECGVRLG